MKKNLNFLFKFVCLVLFLFFVTACSVAPWERGNLAKKNMQISPNPVRSYLRSHVFDSKEASSGGYGAVGGGCGCN
ncbi:MAG: DUF4266 domain-containing protein [Methylococcaceae bacterium]|nr:DUF4266 domain-containing protein [Methylococcaceae bacterium]